MVTKQNYAANKKESRVTRPERASATQQAESALKNVKAKTGDVIHIAISNRTTIELPAHLTQEEIDARVEKYIRLYKPRV